MTLFDGDLVYHRLDGRKLTLAAEGHHNRARADGGVEALGKSSARTAVEVGGECEVVICKGKGRIKDRNLIKSFLVDRGNLDVDVLFRAVGIEEFAGKVNDLLAAPEHSESGLFGNGCNVGRLEVFGGRNLDEARGVLGGNNNSHSLLRFGDSKLGAVKTLVLLGNLVKIDGQTVGKLADGNRNTARAEVIAALDEAGCLGVAEKTLKLALLGRVTLLNLCAAVGKRGRGVRFG